MVTEPLNHLVDQRLSLSPFLVNTFLASYWKKGGAVTQEQGMAEGPGALAASPAALTQSSLAALELTQLSAKSEAACSSSLKLPKFVSLVPFSVLLILVGLFFKSLFNMLSVELFEEAKCNVYL